MTLTSLNDVGPTLQATPAAVVLSTLPPLTAKTPVTVNSDSMDDRISRIEIRANLMTPTLEQIAGWSHGGINE